LVLPENLLIDSLTRVEPIIFHDRRRDWQMLPDSMRHRTGYSTLISPIDFSDLVTLSQKESFTLRRPLLTMVLVIFPVDS